MSRWVGVVAALCLSSAAPAVAQQRTVGDKAAAEALFDHAKKLMTSGRYAEACPKFAESQKLDAGIGTLLYMADCYEKNGQSASAWAGFREAAAAARAANQLEREKIARDRASALEPTLSKLTITVEPKNVLEATVDVTRDGVPVGKALWGTAIPVDPGDHRIAASATGKKRWEERVIVGKDAATVAVHVPLLEDALPDGHVSVAPDDTKGSSLGTRHAIALVVGGLGLVGVGVGTVFGFQAMSKDDEANSFCREEAPTKCSAHGVELSDQAHTAATVSTIAFGVGGAALVGGLVLFLTAPDPTAKRGARPMPIVSKDRLGVGVGGFF